MTIARWMSVGIGLVFGITLGTYVGHDLRDAVTEASAGICWAMLLWFAYDAVFYEPANAPDAPDDT